MSGPFEVLIGLVPFFLFFAVAWLSPLHCCPCPQNGDLLRQVFGSPSV